MLLMSADEAAKRWEEACKASTKKQLIEIASYIESNLDSKVPTRFVKLAMQLLDSTRDEVLRLGYKVSYAQDRISGEPGQTTIAW